MIKSQKLRKEKSVKSTVTIASVTTVAIIAFSTLLVLFAGPSNTMTDLWRANRHYQRHKDSQCVKG